MEGHLLDTSALTPIVDVGHNQYGSRVTTIKIIGNYPIYVSAIAFAEMQYGFQLYEKLTGIMPPDAKR